MRSSPTLDETRLRRAFAADRWDPPPGLLALLLRRTALSDARADYARAARAAGHAASPVVGLDDWLGGRRPDPWLDLAGAAGVDLGSLLGAHELALHVVARTVARCVGHDLGGPRPDVAREAALAVGRALGAGLVALQAAWLRHRNPASIVHFPRLLSATDLAPARRAYLSVVGVPPERSVVGWVEVKLHGAPEAVRALVAWDDVADGQLRDRPAPLRLSCGVVLDEHAGDAGPATFSVFELLERDRNVHVAESRADAHLPEGRTDPDEPASLPPGTAIVDRILLLLGRLCGSGRLPAWLPALPEPASPLPDAPASHLADLAAEGIAIAWVGRAEPSAVAGLLGVAAAVATTDAAVGEAVRAARAVDPADRAAWVAGWRRALGALLVWRAGELVDALVAGVPSEATRFPTVADRWLAVDPLGDRPAGRRRTPGRQRTDEAAANAYDLDPVGSPDDQRMIGVAWRRAYDPRALAAWMVNEWAWGAGLLEVATGLPRGAVSALHPRVGGARDLTAFKKSVSAEGYVFWSLTEVDRAAELGRLRWGGGRSSRDWRRACRRTANLPTRAWPASWPPDGDPPRLERLAAILAGRSSP